MALDKSTLRIVFFGTPDFAVESLRRLVENGYNIVGVVTMPDKEAGRGHKLIQSPVKQYALEHGLKVMQPEKLKSPEFVEELRALHADLQIVIAFRMLPEIVWNMPPLGTFNLHASLLPKYRGAAPINWAVINGEKETGVTTFFLKHEIDTGDVIRQHKIVIEDDDNVGSVHDKLMALGASTVIETVESIINGDVKTVAQADMCVNGVEATPAPKIYKETCKIDWDKSPCDVRNFVRGLSPYPAAWTEIEDISGTVHSVKIFEVAESDVAIEGNPGEMLTDGNRLWVKCHDGAVEVKSLQLAGKKRMPVDAFLRGFRLKA